MKKSVFKGILIFIFQTTNILFVKAQTLDAVSLDCVNSINNSVIEITWSANNSDCNNFEHYSVYVSPNRLSGYNLVAEINDENQITFIDSTSANTSNTFLHYYVLKNCDGETSVHSDTLDTERPKFPIIDYITVVDDDVEIKWIESVSPEADAYIIHHFTDNGFVRIDTIERTNLTYLHSGSDSEPDVKSERYTLSTIDACKEEGAQNTRASETIYLQALSTECSNNIFVTWSPYVGWGDGVNRYQLYASYNGGAYNQITEPFEPDEDRWNFLNDSSDVNDLCFQIRAFRNGDGVESNSNAACVNLTASTANSPDYIYIRNLTILDDGSTQLEYYIDNSVDIETIRYLRGTSADDVQLIETDLVGRNFPSLIQYNDASADNRNRILLYQIEAEDSCGTRYPSKFARTIHLTGKPDGANNNFLTWTGFGIAHGTVNGYTVYRQEIDGSFAEVGNTIGDDVRFSEDVQFVQPNANSEICYRVEAHYTVDYPMLPAENLTSLSNVVCIIQPGRVIAPNAFAPNGVNQIFKPLVLNIDPDNYQMVIMNRWGGVVYETTNAQEGWDGTFEGRDALEGVYAYYIRYNSFGGELREKKGTVLLLR